MEIVYKEALLVLLPGFGVFVESSVECIVGMNMGFGDAGNWYTPACFHRTRSELSVSISVLLDLAVRLTWH
jgi:hypothetical protein